MQRQLAVVPVARRRQAATVLLAFAVLLAVAGILPLAAPAPVEVRIVAVAALAVAAITVLVAWGLLHSVTIERRRVAEAELDALLAGHGPGCECGHDHGAPDGAPPAAPAPAAAACGAGDADCRHDCASCVLSRTNER
jgi:hypothetical protein